jgi:hypothetical protein
MLVGLLVSALAQTPLAAAPANPMAPLGVIVLADKAELGTTPAAGGATIFDGDWLATDGGGALRARFGGAQAYLLPQSSAVMHSLPGGFGADLRSGTIVVSSAQGTTFNVLADGATIHPKTAEPAVAQVSMVSPTELTLTSRRGVLEVAVDGQTQDISEGTTYRMVVQPADPGAPQGPTGAGRNRNKVIFIIIAAAVAATVVALVVAFESPSKP